VGYRYRAWRRRLPENGHPSSQQGQPREQIGNETQSHRERVLRKVSPKSSEVAVWAKSAKFVL